MPAEKKQKDSRGKPQGTAPLDGSDQRAVRLAKLEAFRARGVNPYPERYERTHSAEEARALPEGTEGVRIAGRIMALRDMGRLTFLRLQDRTGVVQVALREEVLGKEWYRFLLKNLDLGDLVGIAGATFVTKTKEPTLEAREVILLGKALLPLPEKWHGLSDLETRYRKRHLDLLVNDESRRVFRLRTRLVTEIRRFLDSHGFEEVETPILTPTASGAMAKPFMTHHEALDIDLALRIAPETYLKRLIVGGYERVYEVAKCFRNEGLDPSHLQEFTQVEFYAAYWNYEDNMRFTEQLMTQLLDTVVGSRKITYGGTEIDFTTPWPRRHFLDLFREEAGIDPKTLTSVDIIRKLLKDRKVDADLPEGASLPIALDVLYKKLVRPKLVQPQFVIAHPADLMPLARRNDADLTLADTFQLLVNGWEVNKAYSELVDPLQQRAAFEIQSEARSAGDEEAMQAEEDYLEAMEQGMPPISGWGMGIDRIVALLADQPSLRDTVFFPTMKPDEAVSSQLSAVRSPSPSPSPSPMLSAFPETVLSYMEDPTLLEAPSVVLGIERDGDREVLILDRTVFYPQGGGQPFDQGSITTESGAQFTVEEVRAVNGNVRHTGRTASGSISAGDAVICRVDAARRTLNSRLHSAGHVIDFALQDLGIDWVPAKGYHFPQGPYVEYAGSLDGVDREALKERLEAACAALVAQDPPTALRFMPAAEMHTVCVNVPDDLPPGKPGRVVLYGQRGVPCGGTHVARLSEIGAIAIRKIKTEGGAVRISYDVARD